MKSNTMLSIGLSLGLALLFLGCSDSDPAKSSPPEDKDSAWLESAAPGTVKIRTVKTGERGRMVWEFSAGSDCSITYGVLDSNGSGGQSRGAGWAPKEKTSSGRKYLPVPAKRLLNLQLSTEKIEGSKTLRQVEVFAGKEAARSLKEADPDFAKKSLTLYSTKLKGYGSGSSTYAPGSMITPSPGVGARMWSPLTPPDTAEMGKAIYLFFEATTPNPGGLGGSPKEIDGKCCIRITKGNEEARWVPLAEYENPGWVFFVRFDPAE